MLQSDQIYYHDIEFCIGGVNMIFSGNNLTNNQNHKKEEDKKNHLWIYVSGVGGLMILQIDCYMGLHPPPPIFLYSQGIKTCNNQFEFFNQLIPCIESA